MCVWGTLFLVLQLVSKGTNALIKLLITHTSEINSTYVRTHAHIYIHTSTALVAASCVANSTKAKPLMVPLVLYRGKLKKREGKLC